MLQLNPMVTRFRTFARKAALLAALSLAGTSPLRADLASDYTALTAGATNPPVGCCPGTVAVHGRLSFPILVEPTGSRLVVEAAGYHSDNASGARGVAFAHDQFGTAGDMRVKLAENAAIWASKKTTPGTIRIGLGPGLNSAYFSGRGFLIKNVSTTMGSASDDLSTCDVFLANWHSGYSAAALTKITNFANAGGGIVMFATPWALNAGDSANAMKVLTPFGLTWSGRGPEDYAFTNILRTAYSTNFSALIGATNLLRDRLGLGSLSVAEKKIAANAIEQVYALRSDLTELNTLVEQISTNYGWISPTRSAPVTPATQPVEAMLAQYQARKFDALPAAQLFTHPAAADWPGLPQPGALTNRTVILNGTTHASDFYMNQGDRPTRRETGLYAPPGTNVTITIPPALVNAGWQVHIGGSQDDAFNLDTWQNFPHIWRRVPLTNATTSIGHVFGGLITVLVPVNSGRGNVSVTISNALAAPAFNLATDSDALWNNVLKSNPGAWGYLQTSNLTIYLPRWQLTNVNNMAQIAGHWAKVMQTADRYYGYAPYRKRAEVMSSNRQVAYGAAYAGYPIELGWAGDTETELQTTLKDGNWGSYHELGHGFQDDFNGEFTIATHAEVDVNLLPGMALTLVHDWTSWEYNGVSFYVAQDRANRRAGFLALPAAQQTWAKACDLNGDVWAAYDFYYNLSDAFGWQVYSNAFGRLMRNLQGNADPELASLNTSDPNFKRNRFYLLLCVAAQRNLDTYFQRYGLGVTGRGYEISANVKTLVANKGYAAWTDNQPLIALSAPAPLQASETLPTGSLLYTYTATDPEPGTIFTYSIVGGNDGAFTIDKRTGALRVGTRRLDYERTNAYTLTVVVSDNGVPRYFRTNTVTVNVLNAPEAPAVPSKLFTVSSSAPAGTAIGSAVATVESGRNVAGWQILSGNEAGWFTLEPTQGLIQRSATGVLPNPGVVELLVKVTDTAGESGVGVLRILCNGGRGFREERWNGQNVFTGPPVVSRLIPNFTTSQNVADNYSRRVSGYLIPEVTGEYTFWIASDDEGVLYLSSDSTPAGKRPIAAVRGWTGFQSFDEQTSQKSAPVTLIAGRVYYLEATQVEGAGGDHLSVAWAGGDFGRQVMSGSPVIGTAEGLGFNDGWDFAIVPPVNTAACVGRAASFSVLTDSGGAFQWQARAPGGTEFTNVPGATAATYPTPPTTLADDGTAYRVIVGLPGTNITTAPVWLSVLAVTAPTATYDFNTGLPADMIYGNALLKDGALELNANLPDQNGAFLSPDLAPGRWVRGFAATFKVRVDAQGALPADGFSFNWAADLPNSVYAFAEEGEGSGLRVGFDTFDNDRSEAPAIDVWWGNHLIARREVSESFLVRGANFTTVQIRLSPEGLLDLTYGCESVFARLPVTGYAPQISARFGLGSRTGGLSESHSLDDVAFQLYLDPTNGVPAISSATASGNGLLLTGTGTPGQNYSLLASTNLVTWTWRTNVLAGNDGQWQFLEASLATPPARHYRVLAFPQLPAGLLDWWRAEGDFADSFGPYPGTPVGGVSFDTGRRGAAFTFDGTNGAILTGGTPVSVPWTACFWVKRAEGLNRSAALLADNLTALKLEQLDTRRVGFTRFGVEDYFFAYEAPTNQWTHLALVANGSGTILYTNGVPAETNTATVNLPRQEMGRRPNLDDHLRGQLDETVLFNRALTPQEIRQALNVTRGP